MTKKKQLVSAKEQGIQHYEQGNYESAISCFSKALEKEQDVKQQAALLSNRSSCWLLLENNSEALSDAKKCIRVSPKWPKGYVRIAQAYENMAKLLEAKEAYEQAACLDPVYVNNVKEMTAKAADKFHVMCEWMKTGGATFPQLVIKTYDANYRGVHSRTKIGNDSCILHVPIHLIITTEVAKRSPVIKQLEQLNVKLNTNQSYIACFLLEQKAAGPHSYWKPYIDILPSKYDDMPIFYDQKQLEELQGSYTLKFINERRMEIDSEYQRIIASYPKFAEICPSVNEYRWARIAVLTRVFGFMMGETKTEGLVPLADMLNHKTPRETAWTYDQQKDGFTITTLKTISKGEPIYDSYGRKCNVKLFVNYGFALEENPDNRCFLKMALYPADPLYKAKLAISKDVNHKVVGLPRYYFDEEAKEAFAFARLICADAQELALISGDLKTIPVLSVRNEVAALSYIAYLSHQFLQSFPTTLEQDDAILSETQGASRTCLLVRRGEKQVLKYYIELAKQCIPLLEMDWKDLKKYTANIPNNKPMDSLTPLECYVRMCIVPLRQ